MLSAELRLKRQIIKNCFQSSKLEERPLDTEDQITETWVSLKKEGYLWDDIQDFRSSGEDTKIPDGEWSRHYESKEVGARLDDGTWVGWTYWSGGGKHGQPESIDWIEYAYDLDVTEEEKMVIVRTFNKLK